MRLPNKRDIYFFFEKISLGSTERVFIYILFGFILLIQLAILTKPFLKKETPIDYSELNKLISDKTEKMQLAFDSSLTHQYFPTDSILIADKKAKETKVKKTKEIKEPTPKKPLIIDINKATLSEWIQIPGIGEKTAQIILDFRLKNGAFTSLEDLKKVKGIGDKKFEKMRPFLKLE
jgi:comEA protein